MNVENYKNKLITLYEPNINFGNLRYFKLRKKISHPNCNLPKGFVAPANVMVYLVGVHDKFTTKYHKNANSPIQDNEEWFEEILPPTTPVLNFQDVLKCQAQRQTLSYVTDFILESYNVKFEKQFEAIKNTNKNLVITDTLPTLCENTQSQYYNPLADTVHYCDPYSVYNFRNNSKIYQFKLYLTQASRFNYLFAYYKQKYESSTISNFDIKEGII